MTRRRLLASCSGAAAAATLSGLSGASRAPGLKVMNRPSTLDSGPPVPANGPLRVLSTNPRYFTNGSGKGIYLAGTHNWHNFQDNGHRFLTGGDPPPVFDYTAYLDFLQSHHHNFFRLWRWESPRWADEVPEGVIKYCQPHPWMRTGPGTAGDGKPKFDLTKFDPEYFDRMKSRVIAAGNRRMYVAVQLFEGWELQFTDAWACHPFHRPNNCNDIDADANGDGLGVELNTLQPSSVGRRVLALQEAYVRKVIDTVNEMDNVLYEVCNEAGSDSTDWQYYMIRYIKEYESALAKQHPVGMTVQYKGGANSVIFNSPADWVSPNPGTAQENYREEPSGEYKGKVIVNDTDHLWGHTGGDALWVWKSFCRGLNVLFMEDLHSSPTWQDSAREGMGQTRVYSEKIDLASVTPHGELSDTGYCLANVGNEYLVLQPGNKGEFTVNLKGSDGAYSVEWLNVCNGAAMPGEAVKGGGARTFSTPFGGPAVLYLKLAGGGR